MRADLRSLRRGQIVQAARTIVSEGGLEALTIAELEKQLGYSRGVISYHFKNKDEIVDELLRGAIAEIDAATEAQVAAATTREARVGAAIGAVVRGFVDHSEATRILVSFWGRIHTNARVRKTNAALYARYREQTVKLLGDGDQATAAVIVGVVLGIVGQAYFDPGAIDVDAAVAVATRLVKARLARAN